MEKLVASLRVALANTFVMYFKVHQFHWNVEGSDFPEYHEFFGDLYEEIYGAVDPFAENIRKLDQYAPRSLEEMWNYKTITENDGTSKDIKAILADIQKANLEVISSLNNAYTLGEEQKKYGLCNFLADRIDNHEKHSWMLKAAMK
jgi:starvation-inducible DNA-binding protein